MIMQLLQNSGIGAADLEGSIVASVVPDVMHSLNHQYHSSSSNVSFSTNTL